MNMGVVGKGEAHIRFLNGQSANVTFDVTLTSYPDVSMVRTSVIHSQVMWGSLWCRASHTACVSWSEHGTWDTSEGSTAIQCKHQTCASLCPGKPAHTEHALWQDQGLALCRRWW